jgi:hypothetical protein
MEFLSSFKFGVGEDLAGVREQSENSFMDFAGGRTGRRGAL